SKSGTCRDNGEYGGNGKQRSKATLFLRVSVVNRGLHDLRLLQTPQNTKCIIAPMSILKVARMGHPVLRGRARALDRRELREPAVQKLIDDLIETMIEYH